METTKIIRIVFAIIILCGCNHQDKKNKLESFEAKSDSTKTNNLVDTEKPCTFIDFSRFNSLFIGLDNPLTIISNIPSNELIVEVSNGTVNKMGDDFIVRPKFVGKITVCVYKIDNDTKSLIVSKSFRVKRVLNGTVRINGLTSGTIKKEQLLEGSINCSLDNMDFSLYYTILEFTLSTYENGKNITNKSFNNHFTKEQIIQINKLGHGDKVYFENIKTLGPDSTKINQGTILQTIE
jgi:hypothetical protein